VTSAHGETSLIQSGTRIEDAGRGTPYALPKPCALGELVEMVGRAMAERIAPTPTFRTIRPHAELARR